MVTIKLQLKSLTIFMEIWRWYSSNMIPESYLKTYDEKYVNSWVATTKGLKRQRMDIINDFAIQ